MSPQNGYKETKMAIRLKSDEILRPGQKVQITRTATITYELDIADYLEDDDDKEISVEQLKECEIMNIGIFDIESTYDNADTLDEEIVSVDLI